MVQCTEHDNHLIRSNYWRKFTEYCYLDKIFHIYILIGSWRPGFDWSRNWLNGSRWKNVFNPEIKFPPRVEFALRVRQQESQEHDIEAGGDVDVTHKLWK